MSGFEGLLYAKQRLVVKFQTARELFPELDLLAVQELRVHELLSFRGLDLHINLVLALLDEAIVVLEVEVDFRGELSRERVECLS